MFYVGKTTISIGFALSESRLLVAGPPRRGGFAGTGAWRSAGARGPGNGGAPDHLWRPSHGNWRVRKDGHGAAQIVPRKLKVGPKAALPL